ncbi:hypothetical protein JTB14_005480 [Gonioctena quinquepunctata]|nr:hypothetical protein JTB14_005480 [Gonioctena quinquepunctata]
MTVISAREPGSDFCQVPQTWHSMSSSLKNLVIPQLFEGWDQAPVRNVLNSSQNGILKRFQMTGLQGGCRLVLVENCYLDTRSIIPIRGPLIVGFIQRRF